MFYHDFTGTKTKKSVEVKTMLKKQLDRKPVKNHNCDYCKMKTTHSYEQTFERQPEVMIFQLERKSINIGSNSTEHYRTPVSNVL